MLAKGVDVNVVSRTLGHADVGTTLRVYGHLLPSMERSGADAMDALFSRPVADTT